MGCGRVQAAAISVIIKAMRPYLLALMIIGLLCACGNDDKLAFETGEDVRMLPLIEVYQPANGSVLAADTDFVVDYAVVRGLEGDYVVIRVDGKNPVRINSRNGRHRMQGLPPGPHTLLIEEYTNDGKRTGGRARISFSMENRPAKVVE